MLGSSKMINASELLINVVMGIELKLLKGSYQNGACSGIPVSHSGYDDITNTGEQAGSSLLCTTIGTR